MAKLLFTIVLSCSVFLSGCSVYMATNQPAKKDLSILKEGTPREFVLAEFGVPVFSEKEADKRFEIYRFYEGSAKGWKTSRALFHAAADVFSLGLWELVGTPAEMAVKGNKLAAKVIYDENDRIVSAEISEGPNKFGHYYEYSYKTPSHVRADDDDECSYRANSEAFASIRTMSDAPALLFGALGAVVQLSRAEAELDSTYEKAMRFCLQEKGYGDLE